MLEILDQIEHVGELTRIASVYRDLGTSSLHRRELISLTAQSATVSHRYPKPESSIKLAVALHLLRSNKSRLDLTETGARFLTVSAGSSVGVSPIQARLLLGLFLDNPEARRAITSVVYCFYGTPSGLKAKVSELRSDLSLLRAARLLQQLGLATYRGDDLFLEDLCEDLLSDVITVAASLSEDELWERLERQRERAKLVEEKVLQWERQRLNEIGEPALAEAVVRISSANVAAGYDIESFDGDGRPRLIEVKSSTGSQLRFYWSLNEREAAARNGVAYWIYFVPFADLVEHELSVIMFNDPTSLIQSGTWVEKAASFEVICAEPSTRSKKSQHTRGSANT